MTLDLIIRMIDWLVATGIGASYTFEGYLKGHTRPFEDGLDVISRNGHVTRIAEGHCGGFFSYPSMTMRSTGGYLGLLRATNTQTCASSTSTAGTATSSRKTGSSSTISIF